MVIVGGLNLREVCVEGHCLQISTAKDSCAEGEDLHAYGLLEIQIDLAHILSDRLDSVKFDAIIKIDLHQ